MMKRYVLSAMLMITCFMVNSQGKIHKPKLSVQSWTFHKYSLLETIDKADSLGIKYLEVYPGQKVGGEIPGVFSYSLDKDARDKLTQYLNYRKMKVVALGVIDKEYYNKNNLENFFEFAAYMKIPFIIAEPEWQDLDEFNRLAAKYKIKVALHCHPKPSSHYWHPDSTVKAIKNRANLGAWPDIGHWARNGIQIETALEKLKGRIMGMHLKDIAAFDNLAAEDTILGKGICKIADVIKQMKAQKFKGVYSIEYEVNPDNNMEAMKENVRYYNSQVK